MSLNKEAKSKEMEANSNEEIIKAEPLLLVNINSTQGRNVSGRGWKSLQTAKSSAMRAHNHSNLGWTDRQSRLVRDQAFKDNVKQVVREAELVKENVKLALIARRERKAEAVKKAEITISISAAKLRRMNKKQLRSLTKK